jgi:hypothetical protein
MNEGMVFNLVYGVSISLVIEAGKIARKVLFNSLVDLILRGVRVVAHNDDWSLVLLGWIEFQVISVTS